MSHSRESPPRGGATRTGEVQTSIGQASTLRRYPAVHVSLFAPAPGRTRWGVITDRCPHCGGRHIHFARSAEQAGGVKRSGCRLGRYWLVVARRYVPKSSAAAA